MATTPEWDPITGQTTTGHDWDGIKELNTPLPGWWVWVFYVCIVWAVAYMVAYPSVPLGRSFAGGLLGWHSRTALVEDMAMADAAFHADKGARMAGLAVTEILDDDALRRYATRAGEVIFKDNCAPCHQAGGAGILGYPALVDDEWLWGGTAEAIETTIRYGVRDDGNYADTRFNAMPAFDYLSDADKGAIADYLLASRPGVVPDLPGRDLFAEHCATCHASTFEGPIPDGNHEMGTPALNNAIWLYGSTRDDLIAQMTAPQNGVMPGWEGRLSDSAIKAAAIYVLSLGGGETE